jgi:hypothetical protein
MFNIYQLFQALKKIYFLKLVNRLLLKGNITSMDKVSVVIKFIIIFNRRD